MASLSVQVLLQRGSPRSFCSGASTPRVRAAAACNRGHTGVVGHQPGGHRLRHAVALRTCISAALDVSPHSSVAPGPARPFWRQPFWPTLSGKYLASYDPVHCLYAMQVDLSSLGCAFQWQDSSRTVGMTVPPGGGSGRLALTCTCVRHACSGGNT